MLAPIMFEASSKSRSDALDECWGNIDLQKLAPKGRSDEDKLVTDMIELTRQFGRYGYRRRATWPREAGWSVSDGRIERLWRREGLEVPQKQTKKKKDYD